MDPIFFRRLKVLDTVLAVLIVLNFVLITLKPEMVYIGFYLSILFLIAAIIFGVVNKPYLNDEAKKRYIIELIAAVGLVALTYFTR